MWRKRLEWKDEVNFKFYDVTVWLTTITIHILSNISTSKGNHTIKFGQAIEYNKVIFFLEKSCRKCDRLVLDPFFVF